MQLSAEERNAGWCGEVVLLVQTAPGMPAQIVWERAALTALGMALQIGPWVMLGRIGSIDHLRSSNRF